jgi:hypothetical protein
MLQQFPHDQIEHLDLLLTRVRVNPRLSGIETLPCEPALKTSNACSRRA